MTNCNPYIVNADEYDPSKQEKRMNKLNTTTLTTWHLSEQNSDNWLLARLSGLLVQLGATVRQTCTTMEKMKVETFYNQIFPVLSHSVGFLC